MKENNEKGFINISEGDRNNKACDIYTYIPENEDNSLSNLSDITNLTKLINLTNLSKEDNNKLNEQKEEKNLGNLADLGHFSSLGTYTEESSFDNKTCVSCNSPDAFIIINDSLYCPECSRSVKQ